ncbi:BLUF domain-containing protein [Rhodovulum steppense]|uniref:FAD-dependent sensor of blue light n=1 Tax=Rhodovulum steppense TaxID=540251 RepID=A0A4R1YTP0_9RHOB|nr:BLUF domain-containing protein [Rhodovulum steppense]TCM84429.1 FAD-dependent sensor of blue light [Rhodovulum steppense]
MSADLFFLLYRSTARRPLDRATVTDILAASLHNNPRDGVTGFLHVDRGCFLQYLEGPRAPLLRIATRINKDRRHTDFRILAEGTIDERFFPDWDMGQIASENLPTDGLLAERSWLRSEPDIDPLPLIRAFAAHANRQDGLDIAPID